MAVKAMLREILELLRRLDAERIADALPRRLAAQRMGIGLTTLRDLIRSGAIATCEGSSRLVPVAEIRRWTAPRAPATGRRRRGGRRAGSAAGAPEEQVRIIREGIKRDNAERRRRRRNQER